jgi:hypothetical protein
MPAPRVDSTTADSKKTNKVESARTARTPSPSTSSFSRFPFFGRRKTAPEVPQVDKKEKPVRKGPAAGTGHEGYGRLGAVRRRSGSAGNVTRGLAGAQASQESVQSNQSHDSFLAERINPVVIAGGEIVENRNASAELTRTDSNQSLFFGRPSLDSKVSSDMSTTSRDGARTTLWPSAFPRGPHHALSSRRPSDSSGSEPITMKSTLAFRRSIQRLRSSPDQTPLRLPNPINTSGITSPSIASLDTSVVSDDSHLGIQDAGRDQGGTTAVPKKLIKRARSPRKWNIFSSRSHSQPATAKKKVEAVTATIQMAPPRVVAPVRPVAFYTMMDSSEQEDVGATDVETALRDAEVYDSPVPRPLHVLSERRPSTSAHSQRSLQLEPRPVQRPQTARAETTPASQPLPAMEMAPLNIIRPLESPQLAPSPVGNVSSGRPSRLPQVGRIPKVVSARPEQTSPKSFSRPFNRFSFQMPSRLANAFDTESVAKGPSPPKPATPELTHESTITSSSRHSLMREVSPDATRGEREFIAFSPRKNSTGTSGTTSSSSGIQSALYAFADVTAVVPDPSGPLAEDDIWDEYNDLLGDDTMRPPPSATSSKGAPFHLESYGSQANKSIGKVAESPTINIQAAKSSRNTIEDETPATASSVYSADMTERIRAAFTQKPEPSTPFSVSEFVLDYGNRNNSIKVENAQPAPSQRTSTSSGKSRKSGSSSKSSEDESPLSQVNLRVGSMTVSKWLTFGHVLFSPARDELVPVVGSLKRHSILVIDGLGNDDWSFYAAETYPAATFFNLSPRAPLPAVEQRSSSAFPLSPPNHHQIQYMSHLDKFPFGPESFTTVVYRFPAAAPESHYRNIVTEARRVLKPGGYLELSILDVDLNNMGNYGRRAVRRLKERIHLVSPEVSLGSSADFILRLLGTKGFSDVKSCRVGVPVASAIARSNSNSTRTATANGKKRRDDRSLAEMMNDNSDIADENITKMVAKVGRWWYSRCYESAAGAGPGKNSGLWTDRAMLSECEEWRTSLKLMVCYARVPDGRTRVASI